MTSPPKLSRVELKQKLDGGHGRALMHLREHGTEGHIEDVIRACLNVSGEDALESDKSYYLSLAVNFSGPTVLQALLASMASFRPTKHTRQRQETVIELAYQGNAQARDWVEANWERWLAAGDTVLAGGRVLWTGKDGYEQALRSVVKLWRKKRKKVPNGYTLHSNADDLLDEEFVKSQQAEVLVANPWLLELGDFPKAPTYSPSERASMEIMSFEEARATDVHAMSWARKAKPAELVKVADFLKSCRDPIDLQRWLSAFGARKYPHDIQDLLDWAKHPDRYVSWRAFQALTLFKDRRVRELGLATLGDPRRGHHGLDLLEKNFQPEDEAVILKALKKVRFSLFHSLAMSALGVFKEHTGYGLDCVRLVYERTPCGICRHSAWSLLENRVSDWEVLLEEGQYDSYNHMRKEARQRASRQVELPPPSPLADPVFRDRVE